MNQDVSVNLAGESQAQGTPLPFLIAGVGASAGGLEALQELCANIQPDAGLTLVVIQHLSPDFKSMMGELLSRHAHLPVVDAEDGMPVAPNTIYVLPNRKDLRVHGGRLQLTEREPIRGLHLPIDIFLESLARAQGELAAAVILSGTGSDGTRGARAVKEAGGLVLVQEPSSARFDGMPKSAIATGLADTVRNPAGLAAALLRSAQFPSQVIGDVEDQDASQRLFECVHGACGVDFTLYKPVTVDRRIRRRMFISGQHRMRDYTELVERDASELDQLVRELLIGVTGFFRDPDAWQHLRETALPALLASIPDGGVLRAWVAGCSTGEEAYTLAMLLDEAIHDSGRPVTYRIFATDVNQAAISIAGAGAYPEGLGVDIPDALRERYFDTKEQRLVVRRAIRDNITFALHNLAADPPFMRIDLACCRNVLIYLKPEVQSDVLSHLVFGLRTGGLLFLGSSESLKDGELRLTTSSAKWKIFTSTGERGDGREVPRTALAATRARTPVTARRPADTLVQHVAEHFGPPGVAVSENFDVLHLFGDVGRYLSLSPGKISVNLLRMVPQTLSVLLSTGARRVLESRSSVRFPNVELGELGRTDVRVEPLFGLPGIGRGLFVCFEPPRGAAPQTPPLAIEDATASRIAELEDELALTRDNLHSAVQDLETSNEELQATNEELIASNEELQSTNEELQSVNEELYTVNSEYQEKIDELVRLNDDLENLLRFVSVGTLFLDRELRIRRYNDRARTLFPLLQQDIGRPLYDIAIKAHYPELDGDARAALEGRVRDGREVCSEDGTWWSVRVAPLRRADDSTGGVILTFSDITRQRTAQRLARLFADAHATLGGEEPYAGLAAADLRTRELVLSSSSRKLLGLPESEPPSYDLLGALLACMNEASHGCATFELPVPRDGGGTGLVLATCVICHAPPHDSTLLVGFAPTAR